MQRAMDEKIKSGINSFQIAWLVDKHQNFRELHTQCMRQTQIHIQFKICWWLFVSTSSGWTCMHTCHISFVSIYSIWFGILFRSHFLVTKSSLFGVVVFVLPYFNQHDTHIHTYMKLARAACEKWAEKSQFCSYGNAIKSMHMVTQTLLPVFPLALEFPIYFFIFSSSLFLLSLLSFARFLVLPLPTSHRCAQAHSGYSVDNSIR